jgi:membrane protein implicated in regulation of membrane protease activity
MALLKYTLLRLALLAATAGVFYLIGLRDWVLLFAAFLVSGVISIFALNRARDEVSTSLAQRQQTINERLDTSADGGASPDDEPDAQSER